MSDLWDADAGQGEHEQRRQTQKSVVGVDPGAMIVGIEDRIQICSQ